MLAMASSNLWRAPTLDDFSSAASPASHWSIRSGINNVWPSLPPSFLLRTPARLMASHFAVPLRSRPPFCRWLVLALAASSCARAHFPFSYSAVESIGLVQAAFPPSSGVNVSPDAGFFARPEYDYLRLQPLVTGYTWHYRGTISNTRTTLPAELKVEVVSATAAGSGPTLLVDYTIRHTVTFGAASAVTTVTGVVNSQGDFVSKTQTTSLAPALPSLERRFVDGGLRGLPRRLMENSSGTRTAYARVSELVAGVATDGLGSQMRVEVGAIASLTTSLGTFETLAVTQSLGIGSLNGRAPSLNPDGTVSFFPSFTGRPTEVRITSAYAVDVGPVRITWTQTEAQREPVTGSLQLVATSFPLTPRPVRGPHIVADPVPSAVEPGSPFVLVADVLGITPTTPDLSAPSTSPESDSAGIQYRWTTPRGLRWTRTAAFYLASAAPEDAGTYQLEVIAPAGSTQTAPARVTVTPAAPSSRLINVASRAPSGASADTIIAGIVLSPAPAAAAATRRLLFRAVGPTLRTFGVADADPDPTLVIYDSANREIARCDNWDSAGDVADRVAAATTSLGTFPLPPGSRDAALVLDLAPGAYTAHLLAANAGAAASPVGLVEIYDASAAGSVGPRIANLSTRCRIGLGDQILIPGIVVTEGSARLLVRGLGPALRQHGITDALLDPEITLYAGSTPIAYNNDWSIPAAVPLPAASGGAANPPSVSQAAQLAGAAPLASGSRDAALVVTLPPGSYTLHVRSRQPQQTGVAIAEVFLLNP